MNRFFRLGLLLLLAAMGKAHAAKVVRLLNAWPDSAYAFSVCGWWDGKGWNGPGAAGSTPTQVDGWYSLTLPASYDPAKPVSQSGIFFAKADWSVSYDKTGLGKGQAFLDIASVLKTSDTVWILPTPLPNGAPVLSGVRPRQTTVMFLNPWAAETAPAASLRNDGGTWSRMKPSPVHTEGWWTTTLIGHTHLRPLLRNADSTLHFGTAGVSPLPLPLDLDSLLGQDTVWIRPAPEPSGAARVERAKPKARTLMLFNPWNGAVPIQTPRISFDGTRFMAMSPVPGYCGWFRFSWYDRVGSLLFKAGNGQGFGSEGLGGATGFDLSATLAPGDTAWISQGPGNPRPVVKGFYGGETGLCNIALLAATVRDFDASHPDFQKGWNGVQKGMILPALDGNRKPVKNPLVFNRISGGPIGGAKVGDTIDTRLDIDWFHTVDGVNTETCRDVPLALDSATGSYVYDNPQYFPIDDFRTLPDGSPNPRRNLIAGDGGVMHNYSFCLESHGEFDYRKGQTFNFRGDDDVWFFIDNRLAVDLGGVHGPSSSSVKLDALGLTEGSTYKFDFFFCERYATGSSLRIQTDMNMRTRSGFQTRETPLSAGKTQYELLASQSRGQGCAATDKVTKATGSFRLTGPGAFGTRPLASGLHYGGIAIEATGDRATIDSASIAGLPPGDYVLRAISSSDTTRSVDIPFAVPFLARPRFLATPPRREAVGSSFPVEIGAFKPGGPDSASIRFFVSSTSGTRFFRDSLLTSPVGQSDTLMTGADGVARRLWVRGEQAGTYALVVGALPGDTADSYPGVTFDARGLRFLDAALMPIAVPWPLRQDPTDTLDFRLEAWTVGGRCTSCDDSLRFGPTTPGLVVLDSNGRPQDRLRLQGGYARIRLVADRTVRDGSLVATGEKGDTLAWSPVTFTPPRLAFVDSLGREIDSLPRSGLAGIPQGPVFLAALGAHGPCTGCSGNVSISANATGLSFFQDGSVATDSIALTGGTARFRVNSPRQVLDLRLVATAASLDPDTLSGIAFRAVPPSGGYVLDADGDGRADSVVVESRSPLEATDSLQFSWPDQTAQARRTSAKAAASPAGERSGFGLPPWPEGQTGCGAPECPGLGTWQSLDAHGGLVQGSFPLRDSVPPVAVRAVLRFSADGLVPDTLHVRFSEPLTAAGAADWVSRGLPSRSPQGTVIRSITASLTDSGTRAVLLLTADSTLGMRSGDSIRIAAAGSLRDPSGIASPLRTAWVPLEFGPRPDITGMGAYPPVRRIPHGLVPPPDEAPLRILVRASATGTWQTLDGTPVQDTARLGGIWIESNRPLDGTAYIYDNLGIHVAGLDLDRLDAAFSNGDLERSGLLDPRGRGRFWLAWNGTSDRRTLVSSGIYTFRVVTRAGEGGVPRWNNRLLRTGWHRSTAP